MTYYEDHDDFDTEDIWERPISKLYREALEMRLSLAEDKIRKHSSEIKSLEAQLESQQINTVWLFEQVLRERNIKVLRELLDRGFDPDTRRNDCFNRTALMRAAAYNDVELAKLLLKYGANPYERDEDGDTPIFIALREENDVAHLFVSPEEIDEYQYEIRKGKRPHEIVLHPPTPSPEEKAATFDNFDDDVPF